MLEWLRLENIGPAPEFELDFAPRVNLITGDNGLGKSFLLDVAWFAVTGTWRDPVRPRVNQSNLPTVAFHLRSSKSEIPIKCIFSGKEQRWVFPEKENSNCLVIGLQIDTCFSIWDSLRNNGNAITATSRPESYVFRNNAIWDGLEYNQATVSNGFIQDWQTGNVRTVLHLNNSKPPY
ncbi:MAG: AAA family ATPase [Pleurocapsa sp. SU_196_0]|nr:AAA family ATPase [Pleurocapsa sp. SU_196_0]